MTKITKIQARKARVCLSAALLAAAGFGTGAWAENKVVIDPLNIQPGGKANVAIKLENEDNDMSIIQLDVCLPKGLDCEASSITFCGDRLDRDVFSLYMREQEQENGRRVYRIMIAPNESQNIEGRTGALAQFTVTANSALTSNQTIEVKNIVASDTESRRYELASFTVGVSPKVGTLTATSEEADSLLLKPGVQGNRKRVSIALSNSIGVRGMQATVTLPDGVTVQKKSNGGVLFEYGERVPGNLKLSGTLKGDKLKVALAGLTGDMLSAGSGEVFAFYVSGTDALAKNSDLEVSDVVLSDNEGASFDVFGTQKVKVVNMDAAYLAPANEAVDSLNRAFAAAQDTIAASCPGVKDSLLVTTAVAAVQKSISDLAGAVTSAYDDETLASSYNAVLAPWTDINAAIAKLVADAKQAQATYVTDQALNAAYAQATGVLAGLNEALAKAVAEIAEACPDVKDSTLVTEAKAAIEAQIAGLSKSIETKKADGTLTAELETVLAPKADIEAAITKLVADAKQAQEQFAADQKAANAAQHDKDVAAVDAAQAAYEAAVAGMAEYDESVKAAMAEAQAAAQKAVAAAKEAAEASFAAGTSVADKDKNAALVAAANDASARLATEAKAAQDKFLAEKEAVEANAAQNAKDTEALRAAQAALDSVTAVIAGYDESVSSTMQTAIATAQAEINVAKTQIEASFAAGTSVADAGKNATLVEKAQAVIAKVAADARKAQDEFLAAQAAANAAQHDKDVAAVDAVQAAYEAAVAGMAEYDESVKAAMAEAQTAAQKAVAAAKEAAEASFAAGTSVADKDKNAALVAAANAAISKLAEDAKQAQEQFVADQKAANAAQHDKDVAAVDAVQAAYEAAVAGMAEYDESVKAAMAEAQAAAQKAVAAAKEAAEASFAAGTSVADKDKNAALVATANAAISKLAEDAKQAQANYETEQALNAAYAQATEVLAGLNEAMAKAVAEIAEACPDVKDSTLVTEAKAAIEAQIAALGESIETKKADGTLTAELETVLAPKADIEAAITKLVADAKQAQANYETEQALNAAYAYAQQQLAELNATLAAAVETIATECADVKDSKIVTDAVEGVNAQVATLGETIDAAKADGSLIDKAEELLASKSAIETAISQMLETARKAQADYETEQALNAAYAQATEVLAGLNEKLEAALEAIATFCPDVKDSTLVTDAKAAIETQIAALGESIETKKADGTLTAELEAVLAPKADIMAAISQMLEDARKAQKDIDTGIEGIEGAENISQIYTLSGKRVSRVEKGNVYIIRLVDGSTKKIMVK